MWFGEKSPRALFTKFALTSIVSIYGSRGFSLQNLQDFVKNIKIILKYQKIWNIQPATNLDFREGQDESKTSEGTFWYFIYWLFLFCLCAHLACVASAKESFDGKLAKHSQAKL